MLLDKARARFVQTVRIDREAAMMLEGMGQVVVIASAGAVGVLRSQLRAQPNATVFSESDFLLAFNTIMTDVPKLIVLDPEFAATARGAALVARIKADPRLCSVKIRALVRDGSGDKIFEQTMNAGYTMTRLAPLDRCGTRRAARFLMNDDTEVRINGTPARLINLSVSGAQVVAPIRVRPAEVIRLVLVDKAAELRLAAVVAWATLEISAKDSEQRYRLGLEFRNSAPNGLEKFCIRHRKDPARAHASSALFARG